MKAREAALLSLIKIKKDKAFSHRVVGATLTDRKVDDVDRNLYTEIVYGTLQQEMLLDYWLAPYVTGKKLELETQLLLKMSVYQWQMFDRIPFRAIVHEAVELAKKYRNIGASKLVNGVLRSMERKGVSSVEEIQHPLEKLSVKYSHPLWLVERWSAQYGQKETEAMLMQNNTPPHVSARVNVMKATVEETIAQLATEGVEAEISGLSPTGIVVNKGNILHTACYKEGLLSIQDESSMLVVSALDVQKGQTILDTCSAPGGKTAAIAEQLGNEGKIIANDLHAKKLNQVQVQAERLGLTTIETNVSDARKLAERYPEQTFDRILIDAPCSGLGVIRRKPEVRYMKSESDVQNLSSIGYNIFVSCAPLVKKGGKIVFSTCTIDDEENVDVVHKFLQQHEEYVLVDCWTRHENEKLRNIASRRPGMLQILPQDFSTDGFFIAVLERRID
ncbi:MAG: 16S rRNA (cytosine(967)-C(5))-methyltransferase RsmB [Bacilli bacterium]